MSWEVEEYSCDCQWRLTVNFRSLHKSEWRGLWQTRQFMPRMKRCLNSSRSRTCEDEGPVARSPDYARKAQYLGFCCEIFLFSSVQFSHSVVPDSLRPHESQHTRPPCPSPSPGVHPNYYLFLKLSYLFCCYWVWVLNYRGSLHILGRSFLIPYMIWKYCLPFCGYIFC